MWRIREQLRDALNLWNHFSAGNCREPEISSAVGAVQNRLRVRQPRRLNLVAGHIADPPSRASTLVPYPQVPDSRLKTAIREPRTIRRQGRISRCSKPDRRVAMRAIGEINLRRLITLRGREGILGTREKGGFVHVQPRRSQGTFLFLRATRNRASSQPLSPVIVS